MKSNERKTSSRRGTTARPASTTKKSAARKDDSAEARLTRYREKRDFEATPEPSPEAPSSSSSHPSPAREKKTAQRSGDEQVAVPLPARHVFVIQKHDARRLHYDLRLEIAGTLASWAVPKGPSYDPDVKRLAVEVEDHPMAYGGFEGRIPEGHYGAGDVLVWDRGPYETVPPNQEEAMRKKGHFHIRFYGDKMQGEWHLVRTRGEKQWLFFKAKDRFADKSRDVTAEQPGSVVSDRVVTRGPVAAQTTQARPDADPKAALALLDRIGEVGKATLGPLLDVPSAYTFEIKYDGYRLLAAKAEGAVRLSTRRQHDWTHRFPAVAEAIARLPAKEAVIDGEACAFDAEGRPSFSGLQRWLTGDTSEHHVSFVAFDLLWLEGKDLRGLPLEERRRMLSAVMEKATPPLLVSSTVEGELPDILAAARSAGLEGLIAKKKGSRYVSGPMASWIKIKFEHRQDCVVCGFTPESGAKRSLGALVLGVYEEGKLVYAGKVGTGFDTALRKSLYERLTAAEVKEPPCTGAPKMSDVRWCRPELCVEIGFTERTREGSFRQPRFLALREDKRPEECVRSGEGDEREEGESTPADASAKGDAPRVAAAAVAGPKIVRTHAVKLSNPDKVLFPRDGFTKKDVRDYYVQIAPFILPHLEGRPINFQRWVDGIDGKEWFQHNTPPKAPSFVRRIRFDKERKGGEDSTRVVVDSVETLEWLVNFAAFTFHQWSAHAPKDAVTDAEIQRALAQPDYVVFDLDPIEGTWGMLIEIAHALKKLLDALSLPSFPKTTGKRGLHILVPIARGHTHEHATSFAEKVGKAVAQVLPEIATVERRIEKRGHKVYVDCGQNGEGKTMASPYTLRAIDGGPVSTPLTWDEVTEKLDPRAFTMKNIFARLAKVGDLWAPVLASDAVLPR